MTVLLLEPNRMLAKTYVSALEQAGHGVIWCQNSQRAIYLADEQRPDVVVLELQLAKHNGIAFLYEFRSYSEWQSVPVIVHSMVPPENLRANKKVYESLAIADYLYKPKTTLKKLISTIDQVLIPTV